MSQVVRHQCSLLQIRATNSQFSVIMRSILNVCKTRVCSRRSINATRCGNFRTILQETSLPPPLARCLPRLECPARSAAGVSAQSHRLGWALLGPRWGGPGAAGRPRAGHVARGWGQSRSSSARVGGRELQGVPERGGRLRAGPRSPDPRRGAARWVATLPGARVGARGSERGGPLLEGCVQGEPAQGRGQGREPCLGPHPRCRRSGR